MSASASVDDVHHDHEQEVVKATTAAFFQTSTHELARIAQLHGSAKDIATYLVLCGGTNERYSVRGSTHGANSVSNRAGISYRSAESSIAWLAEHKFIHRPVIATVGSQTRPSGRKNQVQWIITDNDPNVAICKQFLEGVKNGAKRPLVAFFERVKGSDTITAVEACIDALVLFAELMRELDFGAWGGVSPSAWSTQFVNLEEVAGFTPPELELDGSGQVLVTVEEGQGARTSMKIVDKALVYIDDGETRLSRFWHAIDQLSRAKLVYRALVLWKGDPLGSDRPRQAEPQATLYIHDRWAQGIDPSIQGDVNLAALRHCSEFNESAFEYDGTINTALAGRYRFIVKSGTQNGYTVLAQLRVRFWPANVQIVRGREAEKSRTVAWQLKMRKLKTSETRATIG